MRYFLMFFILLAISFSAAAQDKVVTYYQESAGNPPEVQIVISHVTAHISFKPEENKVMGDAEFTFIPARIRTDSIVFSTPGFRISSVEIAGKQVPFRISGNNLIITPPSGLLKYHQEEKVRIEYEAQPMKGAIYFTGWSPEEAGKKKVIWAHRPNGWLPYIDARVTMNMFYTFDKQYSIFANGERVKVTDNPDNTRTWNYRMTRNHPFFSTCVVVGDYDYKTTKSRNGVPLEYWYYRGDEAKVPSTYQYTPEMMDFFERELDFRYPYSLYRQAPVPDYMYGAMETTTATVFGDFMLIDPQAFWQRNYINTNAHELAHQWFGNYICQFVNKDVWLTESFGTYYAKIFERDQFGEDHYQNIMNDEYNTVMAAARSNNYPVGSSKGGVARIYQKGSLVMGMLRYVMGDTAFRYAVKKYLEEHPYKNALQEDFFRNVYEASGQSYNWFFDEWIRRGGEPHYKVAWEIRDDTAGQRSTYIKIWQVHETNELIQLFRMPVRIQIYYTDGTRDEKVSRIENEFHEIVVPNREKKKIAFVLFDPGRNILKRLTFERSFEELSSQARSAENMIDRYDALVALRSFPMKTKRDFLVDRYEKETFHLTRTEIIAQLSRDRTDESVLLFKKAIQDEDALVRKAVLVNVTPVPSSLHEEFEKALNDFSYLNQELALQNLSVSFPEKIETYLEQTKDLIGWRGLNIRMRWLEIAASSGKVEYLSELERYSGPGYEFETRINAFSTMKRLMFVNENTLANAKEASQHWNNKLASAAGEYLKYFSQE